MADHKSLPQISFVLSIETPAALARVGKTSMTVMIDSKLFPASSVPFHFIAATTLIPPSYVSPLPPLSGKLSAPPPA